MIPVLKLGPFSNQWAQIDVLSLNGWAQCINAWAYCQMGPNTMQEPRIVASAIVSYVLGPKTKTSILGLKPSTMRWPIILGPNFQKPIRSWAQVLGPTPSSQSEIGPKPHHVLRLGPNHVLGPTTTCLGPTSISQSDVGPTWLTNQIAFFAWAQAYNPGYWDTKNCFLPLGPKLDQSHVLSKRRWAHPP